MDNKLQALTDKIYQEGIEKANIERDKIITMAKEEAEQILKYARTEAAELLAVAEKRATELQKNVQAEVRLSVQQSISELKRRITELIVMESISAPVQQSFLDTSFVKKLIEMMVGNFNPNDQKRVSLSLLLPKDQEQEFLLHFKNKMYQKMNAEVTINFDEHLKRGFKIGPRDGSYRFSFTDEEFMNFLKDYLRPRTMDILFGEEK